MGSRRTSGRRWAAWAAIAAVLAGCAIGYLYLSPFSKPIGHGPAGPAVPREAFQGPWSDRRILALGVGDSVTAGYGASTGHSYFDRIISNPPDEWPDLAGACLQKVLPNLSALNVSVSGSTSDQHLEDQIDPFPVQEPDVFGIVFMTTGGNDIIHNYGRTPPREFAMYGATPQQTEPWVAAFETRLDTMLTRLRGKFPGGCHIFLLNIYDPTDGIGDPQNAGLPPWKDGLALIDAYNAVISRCAAKYSYVHLVDMHAAFLGHGIHCTQPWLPQYHRDDPHYWYYDNLEDPNDRGYDAIRRILLLEVIRIKPELESGSPSGNGAAALQHALSS
ncbi:MAG: SGNH/GDSL hydrolase family protein [Candidatus Hydrogenedentes bacterium]|nr:SGNH/GDSL hydrolase family protein [Candidatus Hydrogenedentota bacterium]